MCSPNKILCGSKMLPVGTAVAAKGPRDYNQCKLNRHHTKPGSMISKRVSTEVSKTDMSVHTARIALEAVVDSCQLVHKAAAKRGV
jgi:hypothetical protein